MLALWSPAEEFFLQMIRFPLSLAHESHASRAEGRAPILAYWGSRSKSCIPLCIEAPTQDRLRGVNWPESELGSSGRRGRDSCLPTANADMLPFPCHNRLPDSGHHSRRHDATAIGWTPDRQLSGGKSEKQTLA